MDFSLSRREPDPVDLTPLIDVVFLLLIFFMVSTTFVADQPGGLKLDLPGSSEQEFIQDTDQVIIALDAERSLHLDDQPITFAELRLRLQRVAREDASTTVVIRADREVEHGDVVRLLDLAKSCGLNDVAIATTPQEGEGGGGEGGPGASGVGGAGSGGAGGALGGEGAPE